MLLNQFLQQVLSKRKKHAGVYQSIKLTEHKPVRLLFYPKSVNYQKCEDGGENLHYQTANMSLFLKHP